MLICTVTESYFNSFRSRHFNVVLPICTVSESHFLSFRCLLHEGLPIAEFLGIHHTDAQTPSYIYDGHLQNLQKFLHGQTFPLDHVPKILSEIANGFAYLHMKGLVHMEVSTDTVTV